MAQFSSLLSTIIDDYSSESEHETEPAKTYHRKISTKKKDHQSLGTTKEGYLLKQTWSFQRWRRRYFRLKGHKLYYAKDPKSEIFDEIDLSNLCFAECSTKNVNHSFQVITPTRSFVLGAETRRDMEDWLTALKAASSREFFEPGLIDQNDFLAGHHNWYQTSHPRPTFCNVCRDALSGVTSHGLSCEVCKCKVHKRCAAKAISNCKWTTLASVGKDIIEDIDGNLVMTHQWMEGNLPVSSKCCVCDKTCGSVLRLQDWRCLWCRSTVHTACRPSVKTKCPLGPARVSVVPPTSLHSIGVDEAWSTMKPHGRSFSPLLVFVNSKSGDNQGVKFLRRFKQLLNPAQVFDLISSGPGLGLRLFRHFDPFRILVCSGDGSVGWVLSEIDRFNMQKQCQIAVLPLGTGNDLARVLGWGSSCDDDTHLPQLLERYEKASTKMLDRWSVMVFERDIALRTPKMSMSQPGPDPLLSQFEDSVIWHLQSIIETDDLQIVLSSTKILCETVSDFLARICENPNFDGNLSIKCDILRQKLGMLIDALREEENGLHNDDELMKSLNEIAQKSASERPFRSNFPFISSSRRNSATATPTQATKKTIGKTEKDKLNTKERTSRLLQRADKEALQCRANSLKRAIHNIMDYSDKPLLSKHHLQVDNLIMNNPSSSDTSPCTSPSYIPPITIVSPSVSNPNILECISPLPDMRRDSMVDFFNTLNLPAPRQFADGSRRSSEVPESIIELEESAVTLEIFHPLESSKEEEETTDTNRLSTISDSQSTTAPNDISLEYDRQAPEFELEKETLEAYERLGFKPFSKQLSAEKNEADEQMMEYRPIEVHERNLMRQQMLQTEQLSSSTLTTTTITTSKLNEGCPNTLQIPNIVMTGLEKAPPSIVDATAINVYTSESITIIDTDLPERSSSDETQGDASDILSAISNEECSVTSEILDRPTENYVNLPLGELISDSGEDRIAHIDSPETSDTTDALHGESLLDDISSVLGHDLLGALQDSTITEDTTTLCTFDKPWRKKSSLKGIPSLELDHQFPNTQYGFENRVFEIDTLCDELKITEPKRYCSLAKFDGNDIARKSFKKFNRTKSASINRKQLLSNIDDDDGYDENCRITNPNTLQLDTIQIQIQGSNSDLSDTETVKPSHIEFKKMKEKRLQGYEKQDYEDENEKMDEAEQTMAKGAGVPQFSCVVEPPSPAMSDELKSLRVVNNEARRHSSHTPNNLAPREVDINRRHSGNNPNQLGLDSEHMKFLNCSPAATRRISVGSLFKPTEHNRGSISRSSFFGSTFGFNLERDVDSKDDKKKDDKEETNKKLPIINPLVRLPSWPNVPNGPGFISKCLLANADTLCAAVSPLMDPDETLLEGYYEKCVMNNYFGIGIDAKISLDFHLKREEHPEKCRSRAKNYMWYGVLGSKQWLQKTYKNLDQRVQLECDGQRIPLPSLQGIVILNIPSFMGGTNFWGGKKENDCFLAPSFDDKILEVVAVFGSVQMAASRLINLQHHRIAQCQSIQINILGEECVPIQVDGEAWLQQPGIIRIIHKNRTQMLCRNRNLEVSLKTWEEKQRQHSISILREQCSTMSGHLTTFSDSLFSERESYLLLNFIECVSTLVKWVKFLIISHPSLQPDLYAVASKTADSLEAIHPGGKIVEGPQLRTKLTEMVNCSKQLYEETCELLRERGHSLIMREDLESKLSVALANIEVELRKTSLQRTEDGSIKIFLNVLAPNEEVDHRKKSKPFWLRFRSGSIAGNSAPGTSHNLPKQHSANSRDTVSNWGVCEVVIWLEAMGLSEYVDSFTKNDIRGKELLTLARRDLKDLGVVKVGHIKRILQAIKDLGK